MSKVAGPTEGLHPFRTTQPQSGPRHQATVADVAMVEGFGFWSGKDVRVEFHPAAKDTGYIFVRDDLEAAVRIPGTVDHRIETPRRTTLVRDGAQVEMVEHILAALSGLGITNCEIRVNQSEMPGCDGSSKFFVDAIDKVGICTQDAWEPRLIVREPIRIGDRDHWIEARPATDGIASLRYRLDYTQSSLAIGRQTVEFQISPEVFRNQIACCRTFMLEQEADWLLAQGLGSRVKPTDVLVFDEEGPKENTLLYQDECARHKVLDMVGDFALAGCFIVGKVVAHRSGHRLNADFIRALLKEEQIEGPWRKTA
ncbi:MAG: UDP-3-O-[3-hydroxymyristoyl] N-acetylglucosamine deacetylase [Planctomycetaceae bacterium]|nr:UDP-3-O-[3-hydroxymyristoyl] N-acetylglucosamine deacetylase [Planctomycetaceae bacterium]|tara:strand:+ start:4477 stop:5412 length:936 start_codon:yes stop_codon:yes gene_type:complete